MFPAAVERTFLQSIWDILSVMNTLNPPKQHLIPIFSALACSLESLWSEWLLK